MNDLAVAMREGRSASPLELTADDINTLIENHPQWSALKGKAHVAIEGEKIRGNVSFPLTQLGVMLKDRWLNASAVFRVGMEGGRLSVFAETLTVRGQPLPESFMKSLRAKNLADGANKNPTSASILQRLESITVRDGRIRIVPKQAFSSAPASPAELPAEDDGGAS
ncbi:MAG: hypothetical protein NTW86_14485 [Candidatus Sumerlaeota bacterium]|nr:hypothetical protein [Candidatus Sumerlaeota bacterium]